MKKLALFIIIALSVMGASKGLTYFFNNEEVECMAKNIYFEARNESTAGKIATSMVVLNRVKSNKFPNDICSVIKDAIKYPNGFPKRDRCQFSWYCDGKSDIPYNERAWENSVALSKFIIGSNSFLPDITDGSLYYHGDYVEPSWSKVFRKTLQIDTHIFYR